MLKRLSIVIILTQLKIWMNCPKALNFYLPAKSDDKSCKALSNICWVWYV